MRFYLIGIIAVATSFQMFAQTSKVGTIDVDYILSKMPDLETVKAGVEAYGKELDTELGQKIAKYDSLIAQYQKNETTYGDAIKKTKQDEIIELEGEMQQFRQNSVTLLQLKQNELMQPLYKKVGAALETVAQEQGYTQVLTSNATVAYLDPKFDVTVAVMQKLGLPTEE